jgi:hypothetical protein
VVLSKDKPLVLKYRFYIHSGPGDPNVLDAEWERWAK